MTQDNETDAVDVQETDQEDNSLIRDLRAQIKDLAKELKAKPDRDTLAAELKDQLSRDMAIETQLIGFGHPAGILDIVKGKLGDAEVTAEAVAEALTGIGYKVDVEDATSEHEEVTEPEVTDLAKVTDLSAQVQSAAKGLDSRDVSGRINQADSQEELTEIMKEAGLYADLV